MWMAPIIRKIEIAIRKVAPCDNKLLLHVDDLHVNICNWNQVYNNMKLLLKRLDEVVNWMAKENHLLLKELKHEMPMLRKKRRLQDNDVKCIM